MKTFDDYLALVEAGFARAKAEAAEKEKNKLPDAELDALASRGEFPEDPGGSITNGRAGWSPHSEGEGTPPATLTQIINTLRGRFRGWPAKCNGTLFIGHGHDVHWLPDSPALFGWFANFGIVDWTRKADFVPQDQFFREWRRQAREFEAIEKAPHEPPIPGHFYACPSLKPGDGRTVRRLIDEFFSLESELDAQLLLAMLATPLWGGPPGARPACMITATAGRGRGKTTLAQKIAQLYGGSIEVSSSEDIAKIKTRFLSPDAMPKRIALLDNVKTTRFSWAELESLITADQIDGHRMYVGHASRPNLFTWIITLNGASLSTDLAQRVVEIKLATPKYSDAWEGEIDAFIDQNREAILGDLIAFLRGPGRKLDRPARWSHWEGAVLSRVESPNQCQELFLSRQGESDVEQEEGEIIEDYFADRLRWLDYDPERNDVFIPNPIVVRWYNKATGDKRKTTAVTRMLHQLASEKRIYQIKPKAKQPGTGTRGVQWIGHHADAEGKMFQDIEKRIARKLEERKF